MANSVLTEPYFQDEQAAFDRLEEIIWSNGIVCPHCGTVGRAGVLSGVKGKTGKPAIGRKKCYACRKQFTVRVGTVFESSHVPLHVWFQAAFLMCSSKERHQQQSAAPYLRRHIEDGMVHESSAPRSNAGSKNGSDRRCG